jgi:uncharacterized protein (TIGR03437 family)
MLALLLGTMAGCFGQSTYTSTPLSFPGYDVTNMIWIGDDGKTGFGGGLTLNPYTAQCFTYQNGVATPIATPGSLCQPVAANAGAYLFALMPPNSPYPSQLFAYRNYQFSALPLPDASVIGLFGWSGVNPAGQIATTLVCYPSPATSALGSLCAYAISTTSAFTRLPDQGNNARASAINANGDIAGLLTPPGLTTTASSTNAPRTGSLVVWTQGGAMKNVSSLTGNSQLGIPAAINSKGQIVGPGYLYDGASTIISIQMPGTTSISPVSMNENGEVVGVYRLSPDDGINRPFYYANGVATDLNGLVGDLPKNKLLSSVLDINNAGQILVTALDLGQPAAAVAKGTAVTEYLLTPSTPLTTPVITRVASAASFAPGTSSSTWITILGLNLSTTTRQWTNSDFANGKLPTSLDGVSVTIDGEAAYIAYVSPTQINVLAPDDATTGPVQVQVINSKGTSNSFMATKSDPMPAFFTIGSKYVAALHGDETAVGPPGLVTGVTYTPAKQGEEIQLFGTGFGATTPSDSTGQLFTAPDALANQVTVLINGLPAQVVYAGRTANGLDQINVIVPNVFPDGDVVIQAKVNGITTQPNVFLTVKF